MGPKVMGPKIMGPKVMGPTTQKVEYVEVSLPRQNVHVKYVHLLIRFQNLLLSHAVLETGVSSDVEIVFINIRVNRRGNMLSVWEFK
jgi:hypothetical protein